MQIIIEPQVDKSSISALCDALRKEYFSEACCIGLIQGAELYLRCPRCRHGVILNADQLNEAVINWAIMCLKESVNTESPPNQ